MNKGSRVRLQDVARKTRLAVSTVSMILTGQAQAMRISPECVARVQQAAAELGYRGNYHAKALKRGRAAAVGLFLGSQQAYGYYSEMMEGANRVLAEAEHDLVVIASSTGETAVARACNALQEHRIDALIVPGSIGQHVWQAFEPLVALIVFAGLPVPTSHVRVVQAFEPGIDQALAHLRDLGHRELLVVFPGKTEPDPRLTYILRRAVEVGLTPQWLDIPGEGDGEMYRRAKEAFRVWLAGKVQVSAILTYNETVATGICSVLWGLGWHVPRDVSVVAFDDAHAAYLNPPLTAISMGLRELGRRAAELALEMAVSGHVKRYRKRDFVVECELIPRSSTAVRSGRFSAGTSVKKVRAT